MNVAYLLVSTAWLAGDTTPAMTVPAAPAASPAMVAPAPAIGGGCGCDSGCGCDTGCCESSGWGHRFRQRMGGLFKRHHGGACCDTCAPAPTCCSAPAPAPSCCSAPAATCDSCCDTGSSWGHRCKSRLGGLFHRNRGGCGCDTGCSGDTGCNSCGGGAVGGAIGAPIPGGIVMPGGKGAEQIPAPKDTPPAKMPDGKAPPVRNGDAPAVKGVQINVVPNAPIPASAPALESAPTIAPATNVPAEADNREQRTPF